MLVVWNEEVVGDSQVLVVWNQVSFGWNAAGVGVARDGADGFEVFVGWNEEVIVGQCKLPDEVGGQRVDVGGMGVSHTVACGRRYSGVLTHVCLPGAVVALN